MLQNKTFTKILSLIIAMVMWAYVITVVNPPTKQKIENVPVQLMNTESLRQSDIAISGDGQFFVDVIIQGKRTDVLKINKNDIVATASVLGYGKGENYIPVMVVVPDNVSLVEVKPPKILVAIEDLVSVYKKIDVNFIGETANGTEPMVLSIKPEEEEIEGAKSKVGKVRQVIAKVDYGDITFGESIVTAGVTALNELGEVAEGVSLSSEYAEVEVKMCYTKEVPLNIPIEGEISEAYELQSMNLPKSVIIKGDKGDIAEVKEITTKAVDLSKVTATTSLKLSPKLPENIYIAEASKNLSANISIKGMSVKDFAFDSSAIEIIGLQEGINAVINTSTFNITVSGRESIINTIGAADAKITADVTGLGEGLHVVPLLVEYSKKLSAISVEPKQIQVTISIQNEENTQ